MPENQSVPCPSIPRDLVTWLVTKVPGVNYEFGKPNSVTVDQIAYIAGMNKIISVLAHQYNKQNPERKLGNGSTNQTVGVRGNPEAAPGSN